MTTAYDHGGDVFAVARSLGCAPGDLADFSASINPLGISPMVRSAIIGAVDSLTHYPDSGNEELKRALARHHALPVDRFAVANGSTELIYNLPLLLQGPVMIVAPPFSEYAKAVHQHRMQSDYYLLKAEEGFGIDLQRLDQELARGYGALYLCNPGNPSGALYPLETVAEVLALCRRRRTFLVLDEAFMDFCEEHSAKRLISDDRGIILRSMTKFFGFPGLRLGYAIGAAETVMRLESMGGPWSVNSMAATAGIAALRDTGHAAATADCVAQARTGLAAVLARFPLLRPYPSAANFILVELLDPRLTSCRLAELLLGHRILIRDCSNFVGLSDRFIRLAVRTEAEHDRLAAALGEVLKAEGLL